MVLPAPSWSPKRHPARQAMPVRNSQRGICAKQRPSAGRENQVRATPQAAVAASNHAHFAKKKRSILRRNSRGTRAWSTNNGVNHRARLASPIIDPIPMIPITDRRLALPI